MSDWDFQIVSAAPEAWERAESFALAEVGQPIAFVSRWGRLGSARKVTAVFPDGELDIVVIAEAQFSAIRDVVRQEAYQQHPAIMHGLLDEAIVLLGGYRILKGEELAGALFRFVRDRIPPPRIDDQQVFQIAEAFVCDYVSTRRKIDRGELIAASRWLHHYLVESNLRLLHEFRQRNGKMSFPDGRRLEMVAPAEQLRLVSAESSLAPASLELAVNRAAQGCRMLVRELVGDRWRWPDLSPLGLGTE